MTLREFFINAPKGCDKWDRYFDVYETRFAKYKGKDVTFVEVGVQNGGSIEIWSQYFGPNSKLYGIDIDPKCAELKFDNPNIEIIIGDQSLPEFWDETLAKIGNIDVFIDDGGHHNNQQIVTFNKAFPLINVGGIFVIEDTHTSYWPEYEGGLHHVTSFTEYCKNFADVVNSMHYDAVQDNSDLIIAKSVASNISSVSFYDSMIVLEKDNLVPMRRLANKHTPVDNDIQHDSFKQVYV